MVCSAVLLYRKRRLLCDAGEGGCSFPAFPNGGLARSTSYSRAIFTAHETVYQLPYEGGELQEYLIMRLTGQSCKINLLREALKYLFREK